MALTPQPATSDGAYPASGFHHSFEGGRASGTLTIGASTVRFTSGETSVEMPLERLTLRLGGANDRLIFLEHPERPDWSIYTSDHSILGRFHTLGHDELVTQVKTIRSLKRRAIITIFVVLAVIAGVIALLFAAKDPLVAVAARQVPATLEEKLGASVIAQYRMTHRFIEDPAVTGPVQQIAKPLLSSLQSDRYKYQIHVAADPTVNAFAVPGGQIVLHSGLLLKAKSPEEIAGVLAHEISHISRQHSVRQILSAVGVFALVQALFGDVSGIVAILADSASTLLSLRFSRDFEREADDSGLELLRRAGIDPRGMVSMFERLKEEEEKVAGTGVAVPALLSTHPATTERIERLEKAVAGAPSGQHEFAFSFEAFQNALRAAQIQTEN